MISEINDEELLEFLMTSDLIDNYSPTELKYLITKWRYFYRILQGNSRRDSIEMEGRINSLESKVNSIEIDKNNLLSIIAIKQDEINSMKDRNLTFKERWTGKIILKNED